MLAVIISSIAIVLSRFNIVPKCNSGLILGTAKRGVRIVHKKVFYSAYLILYLSA